MLISLPKAASHACVRSTTHLLIGSFFLGAAASAPVPDSVPFRSRNFRLLRQRLGRAHQRALQGRVDSSPSPLESV